MLTKNDITKNEIKPGTGPSHRPSDNPNREHGKNSVPVGRVIDNVQGRLKNEKTKK